MVVLLDVVGSVVVVSWQLPFQKQAAVSSTVVVVAVVVVGTVVVVLLLMKAGTGQKNH